MKTKQKLELTWIGKDKEVKLEPRILIEDPEKSYGDKDTENMLIHGDNLLALKALEQDYSGKIKCIYIDPPYNTGSAFEHYDDGLEHSIWLSLMKERLEILRNLLSEDGVILVQIDDVEMAYLKILMDEIFGRNNFMNMLVIESGEVFGTKAAHIDKKFVKVKDYILIYTFNKTEKFKIKPLWTKLSELFDSHYSNIIIDNQKIPLVNYLKQEKWILEIFDNYGMKITKKNISIIMNFNEKFRNYMNNQISEMLFQDQPYSKQLSDDIYNSLDKKSIVNVDGKMIFKTSTGSIRYYQSFKEALHQTDDYDSEFCRATARGDLWKNYHLDMRNIDDEGSVKFKNSKKPERLIKDILYTYSNEGDFILDSFLGSGTTAAVSHKMNRKWIGIELGDHCYTHCLPRLQKVVDGEDDRISKSVNWQGGGGFKFYELAPSLLKKR